MASVHLLLRDDLRIPGVLLLSIQRSGILVILRLGVVGCLGIHTLRSAWRRQGVVQVLIPQVMHNMSALPTFLRLGATVFDSVISRFLVRILHRFLGRLLIRFDLRFFRRRGFRRENYFATVLVLETLIQILVQAVPVHGRRNELNLLEIFGACDLNVVDEHGILNVALIQIRLLFLVQIRRKVVDHSTGRIMISLIFGNNCRLHDFIELNLTHSLKTFAESPALLDVTGIAEAIFEIFLQTD